MFERSSTTSASVLITAGVLGMSGRPIPTADALQSAATVDMTIEIETYTCIRPSEEHPPKVPEAGEVSVDHDGYCVGVGNVDPISTMV